MNGTDLRLVAGAALVIAASSACSKSAEGVHDGGGQDSGGLPDRGLPDQGLPDQGLPDQRDTIDSAPDRRILPLAAGRSWTFLVVATGDGGASACALGTQTSSVLSEGTENNLPSFVYDPLCAGDDVVLLGGGDRLQAHPTNAVDPLYVYLDTPIEEGHSWQDVAGRTLTWHDAGTVTVPAGTFTDCWDRQLTSNGENSAITFCRGVGQVRHAFPTYTAELRSKSF